MEVKSNQGDVQDTGPGKWLGNLVLLLSQIPDSSRLIKIIRTSVDEQQCIVNILVQNLTSDEPIANRACCCCEILQSLLPDSF